MIFKSSSILILLILCLSFASAETIFEDDFSYAGQFSTNGWTGAGVSVTGISLNPITSPFGSGAWGFSTASASGTGTGQITKDFGDNYTTGIISNSFNVMIANNTVAQNIFIYRLRAGYRSPVASWSNHAVGISLYNNNISVLFYDGVTGTGCSKTINYVQPANLSIEFNIDLDNSEYDLIVNNLLLSSGKSISIPAGISALGIEQQSVIGGIFNKYLDDIVITTEGSASAGTLDEGNYCTENSDCSSGYCVGRRCVLKYGMAECDYNSQCLSDSCVNGVCDAPSIWQNTENLKNTITGNDETSNTIVSLLIIIALAIGIGTLGAKVSGFKTGALLSLAFIIVGIIFFTLVGWLNPIFLIGILILGLMGLVLVFMMRGDSS